MTAPSAQPQAGDHELASLLRLAATAARGEGSYGCDYVSGTGANSGQTWHAFYVVTAATFSALTADASVVGTFTGVAFPAGSWLFLKGTTAFTLASGSVIAYRAA